MISVISETSTVCGTATSGHFGRTRNETADRRINSPKRRPLRVATSQYRPRCGMISATNTARFYAPRRRRTIRRTDGRLGRNGDRNIQVDHPIDGYRSFPKRRLQRSAATIGRNTLNSTRAHGSPRHRRKRFSSSRATAGATTRYHMKRQGIQPPATAPLPTFFNTSCTSGTAAYQAVTNAWSATLPDRSSNWQSNRRQAVLRYNGRLLGVPLNS